MFHFEDRDFVTPFCSKLVKIANSVLQHLQNLRRVSKHAEFYAHFISGKKVGKNVDPKKVISQLILR
jgi:hypothetical protein